jgi:hypothetical protein
VEVSSVGIFPASARILFELLGLLLADPQFMKRINDASQMLTTLVRVHQSCVSLWVWVRVRVRVQVFH